MALSYTPDSEHILEIVLINSHHTEVFHLHQKDHIRDAHAT